MRLSLYENKLCDNTAWTPSCLLGSLTMISPRETFLTPLIVAAILCCAVPMPHAVTKPSCCCLRYRGYIVKDVYRPPGHLNMNTKVRRERLMKAFMNSFRSVSCKMSHIAAAFRLICINFTKLKSSLQASQQHVAVKQVQEAETFRRRYSCCSVHMHFSKFL
jgi:hypothetical protein